MNTAFVHVVVKPEHVEPFLEATEHNHQHSLTEPGCARFDVLRSTEKSNVFYLYEVYDSADAAAAHKETEHYRRWKETVAPFMAEPRWADKAESVLPEPWK